MAGSGENGKTAEAKGAQGAAHIRALSPAAQRALAEAQARRDATAARTALAEEIGGRGGLDPARYGDWEVKGVASDF